MSKFISTANEKFILLPILSSVTTPLLLFFDISIGLDQHGSSISGNVGLEALFAHPVEQLAWDLPQGCPGQHLRVLFELVEGHKLNDVRFHILTAAT